ncbi:MAG TPA: hypothetical protein VLL52_22540 [Anaerolineae bacterium]|nr:hypothetical protein [Anaerolineae bacterium]
MMHWPINIEALKNKDVAAWTALIRQRPPLTTARVSSVVEEKVWPWAHLTRYEISLVGQSDPITLMGIETSETVVHFYQTVAQELRGMVPYCWWAQLDDEDEGWVVVADAADDYRPMVWGQSDVEGVLRRLAEMHSRFWGRYRWLEKQSWMRAYPGVANAPNLLMSWSERRDEEEEVRHGRGDLLSAHAVRSAGDLAWELRWAAKGVAVMRDAGGWPSVIDEEVLGALLDLLDDPVPMLQPLRGLPVTFVHGNPFPHHWHVAMDGGEQLLGWQRPLLAPPIIDLVAFCEGFPLVRNHRGQWQLRPFGAPEVSEQTMIDGYLVHMSRLLGTRFNAREMRQALPAARCLHFLIHWCPQIGAWLAPTDDWPSQFNLPQPIRRQDFQTVGVWQTYMAEAADRFLFAYRAL